MFIVVFVGGGSHKDGSRHGKTGKWVWLGVWCKVSNELIKILCFNKNQASNYSDMREDRLRMPTPSSGDTGGWWRLGLVVSFKKMLDEPGLSGSPHIHEHKFDLVD